MTRCPKYKHRVKHRLGEYKNMIEERSAQPPSNQASTSGLGDAGSVAPVGKAAHCTVDAMMEQVDLVRMHKLIVGHAADNMLF